MAAAAKARASDCGKSSCKNWPTNSASPFTVCHLPPGTSKWNKIEHRLFSFITRNWRGKTAHQPSGHRPIDRRTTTRTGLKVRCELDQNIYPAGIKVSDAEMDAVNLTRHDFHGEWNYTVRPKALALDTERLQALDHLGTDSTINSHAIGDREYLYPCHTKADVIWLTCLTTWNSWSTWNSW